MDSVRNRKLELDSPLRVVASRILLPEGHASGLLFYGIFGKSCVALQQESGGVTEISSVWVSTMVRYRSSHSAAPIVRGSVQSDGRPHRLPQTGETSQYDVILLLVNIPHSEEVRQAAQNA
jgi:hypothetical protein